MNDAALGRAYRRWYNAATGYMNIDADAAHRAIAREAERESRSGWHWVTAGFRVDGPEFNSFASNLREAENEISDAMLGTKYDRADYTVMAVYARAFRGPPSAMTPDTWSPDDGT